MDAYPDSLELVHQASTRTLLCELAKRGVLRVIAQEYVVAQEDLASRKGGKDWDELVTLRGKIGEVAGLFARHSARTDFSAGVIRHRYELLVVTRE